MLTIFEKNRLRRAEWVVCFVLIFAACGEKPEIASAPRSPIGNVAFVEQRSGNPEAGRRALLNEPYVSCGIPYEAYVKVMGKPPSTALIPDRLGRNAELPFRSTYYKKDGVELVVSNCLNCHASYINGELVIGLGNESLDFTGDPVFNAESLGAYIDDQRQAAEWRRWADRVQAIAPYMQTDTVGVNPATNITLALMAHRDPKTLAWSAEPLIEPPPSKPLPVSVPPWWRLKKKNALYYNTEGRGDHARAMMLGVILCADDVDEVRHVDTYAADMRAYFASLEPPDFPFPVDPGLAKQGEAVFSQRCTGCHGTYGQDWSYPNRVVAYQEIGTDPALAVASTNGQSDRFIRWFNTSVFGETAQAAPAPGYNAPPLDGVWATAPYLHNGSVPTLEGLLNSPNRPKYWTRTFSTDDYDPVTLGWRFKKLNYGKQGAQDEDQRKKIYDTGLTGYANTGHTYGDGLTEKERNALLEYLKTL